MRGHEPIPSSALAMRIKMVPTIRLVKLQEIIVKNMQGTSFRSHWVELVDGAYTGF